MRFVRTTTVAVLLVLAVSFLLGLVARSGKVQELADAVEAAILSRIPGYVLLKGVAGRLDPDKTSDLVPVIVSFDETCRLGLEVDRLDDDRRVVYFPGAPNAWSGVIQIGHTLAYVVAGILIALGLHRITSYLNNPGAWDFVLQIVLGAALLVAGTRAATGASGEVRLQQPPRRLTPARALLFGVVINFVGVPFALPYFAVLDQLLKAEPSVQLALAFLLAYNLIYALPFLLVPMALAILGKSSRSLLAKVNQGLHRMTEWSMPKLLTIIGLVLIADGNRYFWTGSGFI